VLTPGELT